jgi:hypothetical protein
MSKVDEIKQMIEIRYADLKELDCYSPETVLILLEQLRPYVELAELVYENQDTLYIKNYDTKQKYDECIYLIEQQIKEQK